MFQLFSGLHNDGRGQLPRGPASQPDFYDEYNYEEVN